MSRCSSGALAFTSDEVTPTELDKFAEASIKPQARTIARGKNRH